MSSQSRYKHKGSTLDKLRRERLCLSRDVRKQRRDEELQRIRNTFEMSDEEEENDAPIDLLDPDLIADVFSFNVADKMSAMKLYGKEIVKMNPIDASAILVDMEESGIVAAFVHVLSVWPLHMDVFAECVQATLRIIKAIEDKYQIVGWFDDVVLMRFATICHPSFAFISPANAELMVATLNILNYMLAGNDEFFHSCAPHNFHCNVMQIFQQRLYYDDEFGGTQPLPFLKTQLVFLNVFYNEAAQLHFHDKMDDYVYLLLGLVRHAFDCLDSLSADDIVARSRPANPEAGGDAAPPAATHFVEHKAAMIMSLAEEALFSLSHFLNCSDHVARFYFANLPQFKDHFRLLLRFYELYWTRYAVLGTRCRRSISAFFKAIFFHVVELARYPAFRAVLYEVEIVIKLWEVLSNVASIRSVGSDVGVVVDPTDLDEDGTFESCLSTIRDAMIACLVSELSAKLPETTVFTYVSLFSEQIRVAQFAVRKEALMALRTLFMFGDRSAVNLAVSKDVIYPICDMLTVMDVEVVLCALDCVREIMLKDGSNKPRQKWLANVPPAHWFRPSVTYRHMMEETGILDKLDFLMHSPNSEVFELASSVHAEFFERPPGEEPEEDDDEEENPTAGTSQQPMDPSKPSTSNSQLFKF